MCVQVCVECTSDTVVMYLRGIMGGSHCFSIQLYYYYYYLCFVIDFCAVAATTFYIFCTLFRPFFSQFMQQF